MKLENIKDSNKANENYRVLFESSPQMIIVVQDQKIKLCNNISEAITGYPKDELVDKNAFELVYQDDVDEIIRNHKRRLDGEIFDLINIFRIVRKDKSLRWIEMHSVKILWENEAATLNFLTDITDKKISEEENTMIINTTTDAFWLSDFDGHILRVNDAFCKLLGYTRSELLQMSLPDITYKRTGDEVFEIRAQKIKNDGSARFEGRYKRKDGEIIYAEASVTYLPISDRICNFLRDKTDKKKAEEEYQKIVQGSMDSFWIIDVSGRFLQVNDSFCETIGYSRDELLNMNLVDTTYDKTYGDVLGRIKTIKTLGSLIFDSKKKTKSGEIIDVEVSASYMPMSDRICAFARNITERKRREEEVVYLSYHDVLTGVYNRAFFEEECKRLDTSRQLPISLVMGDVNGLKLTNDVFGHAAGDQLLRTISSIMKKSSRHEDIVARIGGDEFCILLPNTENDVAQKICERIYEACAATKMKLDDGIYHPSVSLGFATKHNEKQLISDILRDAENSMYKRKLLESKSAHSSIVASMRSTMFERSHENHAHTDRLSFLARIVGEALNLPYDELSDLELLGTLHDIGKIGVDGHIFDKKGPLNEDEWEQVKKHPEIGYRIAQSSPELRCVADGILYHHERWDGTGYPQGLSGENIPIQARIISVVDAFDVMTHDRVYRRTLSFEEARQELLRNAGKQFDPNVVQALLTVIKNNDIYDFVK